MLRILGRANSFNVRKVLWLCDELGLAYEREDWGRGYRADLRCRRSSRSTRSGWCRPSSTTASVLRESNTIVRYLATQHGPEEIYPNEPLARAGVEQWMDWANYETSISLRGAFLGGMLNEPPWNNAWFIEQGRRQITKEVGQLDAHLAGAGPFMTGATFTIGDIPIGLVVNRWFALNFERPDYAAVGRYYERLSERPAYRLHVRNGLP